MKKYLLLTLAYLGLTPQDIKYAVRNFVLAFAGVFFPGVLGWLHGVSAALSDSTKPVPDWHVLGALAASAVVAAFISLVTLIVRALEGKLGKAFLRPNPPRR